MSKTSVRAVKPNKRIALVTIAAPSDRVNQLATAIAEAMRRLDAPDLSIVIAPSVSEHLDQYSTFADGFTE